MAALLFVAAVVILAVVGGFLGADSRDGADWSSATPQVVSAGLCEVRRRAARGTGCYAKNLPDRFVRCESVPGACRDHSEMSLAAGSRQGPPLISVSEPRDASGRSLAGIPPSKQAALA